MPLLASRPGQSPHSALSLLLAASTFLHISSFRSSGIPTVPSRLSVSTLNPFFPVILYVYLEYHPSFLLFLPPHPTFSHLPPPPFHSSQTFQVLGVLLGDPGIPGRCSATEKNDQPHILEIAIKNIYKVKFTLLMILRVSFCSDTISTFTLVHNHQPPCMSRTALAFHTIVSS